MCDPSRWDRAAPRGELFELCCLLNHPACCIVNCMMKLPPVPQDLNTLSSILESLPEERRERALTEILEAPLGRLADTLWEMIRDAMIHTRGVVPAAEWEAQHLPLVRLTDRDRWLEAAREGYVEQLVAQGLTRSPDTPKTAQLRLARLTLLHRQRIRAAQEEQDLAQDLIDSKLPRIVTAVSASIGISHVTAWRRFQRGRGDE